MFLRFAIAAILAMSSPAWAQSRGSSPLPADERERCRYGAEHMIEFGKKGLVDPASTSRQIEKRRRLLEEWHTRLERGEDPCAVYLDIQKAATTF